MQKNKGKLFVYETVYLLALPALFLVVYAMLEFFALGQCGNLTGAYYAQKDKNAMTCLYVFYAILVLSFVYRTFTTRKIYKKMRVDPKRLFLYRLIIVMSACVLYTTIALLLGTARIAHYKKYAYLSYLKQDYLFVFAMQGKRWWYILFGFSVAMSVGITYALTVCVENLIYSRDLWFTKVLVVLFMFFAISLAHSLPLNAIGAPTLGSSELFRTCLPVGEITRHQYASYLHTDVTVTLTDAKQTLAVCYVAWHISNLAVFLSGIAIIIFCYLSITFLTRRENDDYLYGEKESD